MVSLRFCLKSERMILVIVSVFLMKNVHCAEIPSVQKRDGDSYLDALKTSHTDGEVTRE